MGNNENDLSDNIYDRNNLIEFLFKIIDSWFTGIWQSADYYLDTHSIHDLFSKDSWLMERMEWDTNWKNILLNYEFIQDWEWNPWIDAKQSYDDDEPWYHYCKMSMMTAEEKIKYFPENAIIPSQK